METQSAATHNNRKQHFMAYISTTCPKYSEKLLHGHFFGTKRIKRLVVFYPY